MIQRIKTLLFDIFFPPTCLTCAHTLAGNEKNRAVCGPCIQSIPLYDGLFCPTCLRRVAAPATTFDRGEADSTHSHARYLLAATTHYTNDKIQKLISQLKYHEWLCVADPLAELMTTHLRSVTRDWNNYVVMPLPLHQRRELKRGFNQAAILATRISRMLLLPLITHALIRTKNTDTQTEQKDYRAREKNIAGAFHMVQPETVTKKNILLVDDVFTSGATLNEATRVLKSAGARAIVATVIARAR